MSSFCPKPQILLVIRYDKLLVTCAISMAFTEYSRFLRQYIAEMMLKVELSINRWKP
jgi:hypothetical protein